MKLIKKIIYKELPLEIGKEYITRIKDRIKIINIKFIKTGGSLFGGSKISNIIEIEYIDIPHLGKCTISEELIVKEKMFDKEILVCSCCGDKLEE